MTVKNEIKDTYFQAPTVNVFNNTYIPRLAAASGGPQNVGLLPFNHLTRLIARGYFVEMKIIPKEGIAKTPITMVGVTAKV
jgi:hypothetical protein